ncbi:membrane-associated oxidoreductase [Streptomyces sp. NPDC002851]
MEIPELTPAEERVWQAFPRGEAVNFRPDREEDAALGATWGPERTVRAEVLRALLLDGPREGGETAVLKLTGARIVGRLDLEYAVIDCGVHLWACHFEDTLDLYGAQIRQLALGYSYIPLLHAVALRVDGSLRMTRCQIPGPVRLGAARVGGALFLDGARIGPRPPEPDDPHGDRRRPAPVLQLVRAVVDDNLSARGMTVHGEVELRGAAVAGSLHLDDAELNNPGGTALDGRTLSVGSDLHGKGLRASGWVNLRGTHIPGQLNLAYSTLSHPGDRILRLSSATIGELWLRGAAPIEGEMTLRRSQIGVIHLAPESYPDQIWLDGCTYTTLAPREPAERRLALLERDKDGYVPYAYEQLATAYRRIGDDAAARTVQLARQRRHRATLPGYARAWGLLQDVTVGYGFRPVRAAGWLASLLLVGAVTYGVVEPRPLKADEDPGFNAFFYTLDLLLPIVDFGQERAYDPSGWTQWLAYALIITGWVLATTIAAGITRTISRQ